MSDASTFAGTLRTLADLAEIRGAAAEAVDLRLAATAIDALTPAGAADLIQRARRNRLKNEPGITPALHSRLRELTRGGGKTPLGSGQPPLPALFTQLLALRVIETEDAAGLVRELDILTLCELQVGLEDGRVRQLGGDGLDTRLRQAARTLEAGQRPIPLGRARDLLDALAADIAASSLEIELVTPAGDVRRFESLVFALAIVGRAIDPPSVIDAICATGGVDEVRHRSGRRAILSVQQAEIDIRVATPDEYGTCLFYATGSPAHLRAMHLRVGTARLAAREEDL